MEQYLKSSLVDLLCELINSNVAGSTDKNLSAYLKRKQKKRRQLFELPHIPNSD